MTKKTKFLNDGTTSHFEHITYEFLNCGLNATPSIKVLDFLNWSKNVPGAWQGATNTALGRAIAAISYLHNSTHSLNTYSDLMWITSGIEALFCKEGVEIRARIGRRAFLLCPDLQKLTTTKKLQKAYDYRSRLFHGDSNTYFNFDYSTEASEWRNELLEIHDLLTSVLIKSIQEMSNRNIFEMSFVDTLDI